MHLANRRPRPRSLATLGLWTASLVCTAASIPAQRPSAEEMVFLREGVQHHNAGEYDAAVASYQKALQVDPRSGVAHYQLAFARQSQGQFEQCLEWAEKGLEGGSLAARMNLFVVGASCAESLDDTARAVELFEQGLTEFPGRPTLTFNFAVTLAHLDQNDRALQLLREGLELDPRHASSHRMVALIAGLEGRDELAQMAAVRFLSMEPQTDRAPEMLGVLESLLRRAESAAQAAGSPSEQNDSAGNTGEESAEDASGSSREIGSLRLEVPEDDEEEKKLVDLVLSAANVAATLAPDGEPRFPGPERVATVETSIAEWAARAAGASSAPSPFAPSSPAVAVLELKRSYRAFYAKVIEVRAVPALAHFALQSIGGDELEGWPRRHQDELQRLFRLLAEGR